MGSTESCVYSRPMASSSASTAATATRPHHSCCAQRSSHDNACLPRSPGPRDRSLKDATSTGAIERVDLGCGGDVCKTTANWDAFQRAPFHTWKRMNCQTSVIHRPTGKVGGRWVTCVPYDPSVEMLDEGMTNGRLKGNQSNRSSWTARPPAALADWVTTGKSRGRC